MCIDKCECTLVGQYRSDGGSCGIKLVSLWLGWTKHSGESSSGIAIPELWCSGTDRSAAGPAPSLRCEALWMMGFMVNKSRGTWFTSETTSGVVLRRGIIAFDSAALGDIVIEPSIIWQGQ